MSNHHDHDHAYAILLRLPSIFKELSLYRQLLRRTGPDAQHLLDSFQSILDLPYLDHDLRRNLIVAIQRLSFKAELYPKSYELKYQIQTGEVPVTAGGFADIFRGIFGDGDDESDQKLVCLKVMRVYETSDKEHIMKQFAREVLLWGQLSHPNVLPIYGLHRLRDRPCIVMPWMENGDVIKYLKEHPSAPRFNLVIDVTRGLEYLHAYGIIHGDLKGANILISTSGRAYVADFGISSISSDPKILAWTSHSSVCSKGGSVRWQAPELFYVSDKNTESSDVYAWGCVCYEIFTGQIPLSHITRATAIMHHVKSGLRPTKPPPWSSPWTQWGLTPSMWSIMESSWVENPLLRPTVNDILRQLGAGKGEVEEDAEKDYDHGYPTRRRFKENVIMKCGDGDLQDKDGESYDESIRILDELLSKMGETQEEGSETPKESPPLRIPSLKQFPPGILTPFTQPKMEETQEEGSETPEESPPPRIPSLKQFPPGILTPFAQPKRVAAMDDIRPFPQPTLKKSRASSWFRLNPIRLFYHRASPSPPRVPSPQPLSSPNQQQ